MMKNSLTPLRFAVWLGMFAAGLPSLALAHGDGLNAEGCHNDRKKGGYHCHRAATPAPQELFSAPSQSRGVSRNCGAAPGQQGPPRCGLVTKVVVPILIETMMGKAASDGRIFKLLTRKCNI